MAGAGPRVMVGGCDGPIEAATDATCGYWTSKLGGRANWVPRVDAPPADVLRCALCGRPDRALVLQLYAPLPDSVYHRVLYVFACPTAECMLDNKGWCVVRVQQRDDSGLATQPPEPEAQPEDDWGAAGAALFGGDDGGDDGWGDDTGLGDLEALLTARDEKAEASVTEPTEPSEPVIESAPEAAVAAEAQTAGAGFFQPFYVYAVEEPETTADDLSHERKLLKQYEKTAGHISADAYDDERGGKGKGKAAPKEGYEKTRAPHGDVIFEKFLKRIRRHPPQVLRHCFGGKPLAVTDRSAAPPKTAGLCGACGGPTACELQLVPGLINWLRPTEAAGGAGLEPSFITLVVHTCTRSCWTGTGSFRLETAFVQRDPDADAVSSSLQPVTGPPR